MRAKTLFAIASSSLVALAATGFVAHGIRSADERLALALSAYELGNAPDRAEAQRVIRVERACHQKAIDASPDPRRMSDRAAQLSPEEIAGYSSRHSACLADDLLASKRPTLESAQLYYSAALPFRIYQAVNSPDDQTLEPLLARIQKRHEIAFERDLARAKAFRPIADAACIGFWGARACHSASGGRSGAAFRQRYLALLIDRRESLELARWKVAHPLETYEYEARFRAAIAANEPTPRPPWADAIDELEERLKPLVLSDATRWAP